MKIEVNEQKLIMLRREYENLKQYILLRPPFEERFKILRKLFEEIIVPTEE